MRRVRLLVIPFALVSSTLIAQQQQGALNTAHAAKPTLTTADYAKWETLGAGVLSPDGKWVAYDFRRGNASVELRYRRVGAPTETAVPSGSSPQFTSNSRWLVYTMVPDTTAGRGGRGGARGGRGGGGANAAPAALTNRNKVVAVDLSTGHASTFEDIQSYSLSNDGVHVALRRYPAAGRRSADVIVRDLDAGS